ncbi:RNA polymerase sigma factor [Sphingobacterium spiritivorum]|uniref:Sigma-70 region 2 n=3 Tax=Sphingobacterium spiritivorum TaxID=258 RepID=D7VHS5_SPHSI|nr:sigma-70 family RNA polymerase sigma factor [Sphingobacterium spiritivorum]EEI91335.1 Sigma-70 region 2 [Sphingobacterium spiritivorum ATCC 33300]EFK59627.1 Sigma-70 region 2 [Sphingobacterium spiritivorum ATCC 33861]QQS97438.1 sigma-70 family RNA polymerase sigma factor [Sphingobacterium spiritivorum]QQT37714.1 sigma-70 family RNA polymerase sigma factor [Sphingobacterium spiritivorum]WQD34518.1 sigma-70 family RNA polymerase sigma factor [Sphingobacterium spiritivorum]
MKQHDIDEVWKKCKTGDRKSQSLLYQHFAPRMYAVCIRYAVDTLEAEDMLQTGFIKVFAKHHLFDERGSLEGWIRRVMVNTAIEIHRKNKVSFCDIDENLQAHMLKSSIGTDQSAYQDLMQLVKQLPVGYRTVFNLYAIEGYTHHEIAKSLHISEGNSKSQLSRARTWLKDKLQKLEETER